MMVSPARVKGRVGELVDLELDCIVDYPDIDHAVMSRRRLRRLDLLNFSRYLAEQPCPTPQPEPIVMAHHRETHRPLLPVEYPTRRAARGGPSSSQRDRAPEGR